MTYAVRLEAFEGPLDLLLHLIEKNKVDIRDIPVASITHQYIEYLGAMSRLDLEAASEFLVMAATLMDLKARTLLPRPPVTLEDEDDPRQELVDRLLEYKRFKALAAHLRLLESQQAMRHTRPFPGFARQWPDLGFLEGCTLEALSTAFQQAIGAAEEVWAEIPREEVSFRRTMRDVVLRLSRSPGIPVPFREIIREKATRLEVIVTFLVVLELVRLRRVLISQPEPFGEIEMVFSTRQGGKNRGREGPRGH
ncbi:MAG: segregation/condensation protein A [Bacillota bacterium]